MSFPTKEWAADNMQKRARGRPGYIYQNEVDGRWDWCLDASPYAPFVTGQKPNKKAEKWRPVNVERVEGLPATPLDVEALVPAETIPLWKRALRAREGA